MLRIIQIRLNNDSANAEGNIGGYKNYEFAVVNENPKNNYKINATFGPTEDEILMDEQGLDIGEARFNYMVLTSEIKASIPLNFKPYEK